MVLRRAPRNIVSSWDTLLDKPHLHRILDADDQAAEKAVNALLQSHAGALGKRYLELSKVYAEARQEALKTGVTGLLTRILPGHHSTPQDILHSDDGLSSLKASVQFFCGRYEAPPHSR